MAKNVMLNSSPSQFYRMNLISDTSIATTLLNIELPPSYLTAKSTTWFAISVTTSPFS